MKVVGLAYVFGDVHMCRKGLHFQNCLTKVRLFQNHMPHLFFFLHFFLWSSQRWHSETLSPDLALLKNCCKRGRKFCFVFSENKNNFGKVRMYKEKAILSSLGVVCGDVCVRQCPYLVKFLLLSCQLSSTCSLLNLSHDSLHWDISETCSQQFPFCMWRRRYTFLLSEDAVRKEE